MKLSFRKKILFYGILLSLFWAFLEVVSFGVFRFRYGKFSLSELQKARSAVTSQLSTPSETHKNQTDNETNRNIIHPYLGFITEGIDPDRECPDPDNCDRRKRTYEDRPWIKSTDDNVIIAVMGGSFAAGAAKWAPKNYFGGTLKKSARYRDKKIVLYNMAVGGYKQPQQLLKLNYYLSLGAEFDVVINIDGFNEIALPRVENLPKGVSPFFPRAWYYYVDGSLDPTLLAFYGERESLKKSRAGRARLFSSPFIEWLPSANLVWKASDRRLAHKINLTDIKLAEYSADRKFENQYATTGPDYRFSTYPDLYQDMAKMWARSSLQLYHLCRSQGIKYYHILQPNQYVKGSKPMSKTEARIAISSKSRYGKAYQEGYPFLVEEGKWLQEQGVPFHDLSMIFAGNPKPMYIDNCCHLNPEGYGIVIREIARIMGSAK